jgi:hypothetical protein
MGSIRLEETSWNTGGPLFQLPLKDFLAQTLDYYYLSRPEPERKEMLTFVYNQVNAKILGGKSKKKVPQRPK